MNSGAVYHEESEYIIGFLFWLGNNELSLILREKCTFFLTKRPKMHYQYLTHISTKTGSNSKHFITKMISAKSSTNPESFIRLRRGRRIAWRLPMETPLYIYVCSIYTYPMKIPSVNFEYLENGSILFLRGLRRNLSNTEPHSTHKI